MTVAAESVTLKNSFTQLDFAKCVTARSHICYTFNFPIHRMSQPDTDCLPQRGSGLAAGIEGKKLGS